MSRFAPSLAFVAALLCAAFVHAAEPPTVEFFSPEGTVKGVRQVTARFSVPMVPLGDPRLPEPFDIDCPEKGTARWADSRNWVYDFDRDLPAGVTCAFRLKPELKSLDGTAMSGERRFAFSTGGPAILRSVPYEGAVIEEHQIFILGLDTPARESSILRHAGCTADGINEKIGVQLIKGKMRERLLEQNRDFLAGFVQVLLKSRGGAVGFTLGIPEKGTDFEKQLKQGGDRVIVLQCARRLPAKAEVHLVWGAGITSNSGIASTGDQQLAFQVRPPFRARFSCEKVNKNAACIPFLPLSLNFSSPVPRRLAAQIVLTDAQGKTYKPKFHGAEQDGIVTNVYFDGPLPEKARLSLRLPEDLRDDSGRPLYNRKSFPLTVKTDIVPPLAKFPANFGIIELNAGAVLPVTVRNLESSLDLARTQADDTVPGRRLKAGQDAKDILHWLSALKENENEVWEYDEEAKQSVPRIRSGDHSIFGHSDRPERFKLPKPNGAKAFEVMGIPLEKPGFYVVELASPKLGASLLGKKNTPYYVRTGALVTNLSAHFKQGRESSLVWVTALDKGEPTAGATVEVRDCGGHLHWQGKTDKDGIARIEQHLPERFALPQCGDGQHSYFVTARQGDDLTFVFSHWNEGINPWRFNLPGADYQGPVLATTVFDRTLLRAGETVHMKHFYRRHTRAGFAFQSPASLPAKAVVTHQGSDQKYELPLKWAPDGTAESDWVIPKDAKQGTYEITLAETNQRNSRNRYDRPTGSFRVEAFRVPTMKALLSPLGTPLVNVGKAEIDVQVNYLSGGGASSLPVKLRSLVLSKTVSFPDYDGFIFANGGVKEGLQDDRPPPWQIGEYEVGDDEEAPPSPAADGSHPLATLSATLDAAGAARVTVKGIPRSETPQDVTAELEYRDPNGETLTASSHFTVWPSRLILGIKPDGWAASKDHLKFQVLALSLAGKPLAGVAVKVDFLKRESYSHRKRLIGGFYAYEHRNEVKRLGEACEGKTDDKGRLFCDTPAPSDGNIVLRARAADDAGNPSQAHQDVWVAGKGDWWFEVNNDDRMDVIPEQKRYEPGDTAVFQVRMPFREATALVTVEREGVMESRVEHLSGKAPVIRLPLTGNFAPNVYVSVLAVRGRLDDVQPTALIDLGKPAFKLGIAQINVGWRAHELKVNVAADKPVYRVRDRAKVKIKVQRADGGALPKGAEVALAAVDEGLLELMPNNSWKLLEAMMKTRGIEVETSTAQMQVVGKRHFGRKAFPHGGGGGRQASRELFDTLLKWQGRVTLDGDGEAEVDVPLNDSLTSFRLVAVAHAGAGLFGTGATSVRTSQDVMLLSGLPPLVREQDQYRAGFTVRNASDKPLTLAVEARLTQSIEGGAPSTAKAALPVREVTLAAGEAKEIGWSVTAPVGADALQWDVSARAKDSDAGDRLKVVQKVIPTVTVRTFQATLMQLDKPLSLPMKMPADAIPGRGGLTLHLKHSLADELPGVQEYMGAYPYICLEQKASQAIALRDEKRWNSVMAALPSYLDRDGLAKYFPEMHEGSDTLTAYLLAVAAEAGWNIPDSTREKMQRALVGFVEGRVRRYSALPTADLAIRKLAALDALSRHIEINDAMTQSFSLEPNLWPTSAVLDWYSVLKRSASLSDRGPRMKEAERIIRSRLNFQGTTMGFSTERGDFLWWLMLSGDVNANRAVLDLLDEPAWREDLPRMVRGSLGRQHKGHWNTTVANAWGTLAMEKFAARFEAVAVTGRTEAEIGRSDKALDWGRQPKGGELAFGWPKAQETLKMAHQGTGKPWLTVQARAAIPLTQPFSSGFKTVRTVTAVDQKIKGRWSRGDVMRVHLDLESQSDMSWVVVNDPIPAGSSILGTGLGRDSKILTRGEKKRGWVWPAFEERTFDAFRAYYEFVPKGKWTVEYTVRLNNPGRFDLPETRVEAMYNPEMFGELPNRAVTVEE